MKILHSADWHLGSPFSGFPDPQKALLRRASLRLPEQLTRLCREEGCDLVLLSGDLVDGPVSFGLAEILAETLKKFSVPVLISPGNHDFVGPGSLWLENNWPDNVHIFTRGLESVSFPSLNCRVYGAGYRSMDCEGLLEGFRAEGPERYKLAVLHGDPTSASSPYCPITAPQIRASGLDYLALGHIHSAGQLRAGSTLCGWPGCPMGRGYDETGEKGVYIVELEESASLRFVQLDTVRFFDLEADIQGDAAAALEKLLPAAPSDNFYRVTLTGNADIDLPALRHRFSHCPQLELRDRTLPLTDLWEAASEDTLEGTYFRLLRDALEEADPEQANQIRLAAALSRRLLDGREVTLP